MNCHEITNSNMKTWQNWKESFGNSREKHFSWKPNETLEYLNVKRMKILETALTMKETIMYYMVHVTLRFINLVTKLAY